jgi:hypothetical protein
MSYLSRKNLFQRENFVLFSKKKFKQKKKTFFGGFFRCFFWVFWVGFFGWVFLGGFFIANPVFRR